MAIGIPEGFELEEEEEDQTGYESGLASTFGYNDPGEGTTGAWGDPLDDPNAFGVALPRQTLRDRFGDEDKAKGALVEVRDPATGNKIVAPIIDKGPANWVIDRQGPTIDLTEGARRQLGHSGGLDKAEWRFVGQGGQGGQPTTTGIPEGFELEEPSQQQGTAGGPLKIVDAIDQNAPYMSHPRDTSGLNRIILHGDVNEDADALIEYGRKVDTQRGFAPGYHFYVARDGTVKQGAPVDRITNHTLGENKNSIGINVAGADEGKMPTDAQVVATKELIAQLGNQYHIDSRNVIGHGELQPNRRNALEGGTIAKEIREQGYGGTEMGGGDEQVPVGFELEEPGAAPLEPASKGPVWERKGVGDQELVEVRGAQPVGAPETRKAELANVRGAQPVGEPEVRKAEAVLPRMSALQADKLGLDRWLDLESGMEVRRGKPTEVGAFTAVGEKQMAEGQPVSTPEAGQPTKTQLGNLLKLTGAPDVGTAMEMAARVEQKSAAALKGQEAGAYGAVSEFTRQGTPLLGPGQNRFLGKTADEAKEAIPALEERLSVLQATAKAYAKDKKQGSQEMGDTLGKIAAVGSDLKYARETAEGKTTESFVGRLSKSTAELEADALEEQKAAIKTMEPYIDKARDKEVVMQLADQIGYSGPATAESMLLAGNPLGALTAFGAIWTGEYSDRKAEFKESMEKQGKPYDPEKANTYAANQANEQAILEVLGDKLGVGGVFKGIAKMLPANAGKVGTKVFGKWLLETAKEVAPDLFTETATEAIQSYREDVLAEKHGVQEPTTVGEKVVKAAKTVPMTVAQTLAMGGGPALAQHVGTAAQEGKAEGIKEKLTTEKPKEYKSLAEIPPETGAKPPPIPATTPAAAAPGVMVTPAEKEPGTTVPAAAPAAAPLAPEAARPSGTPPPLSGETKPAIAAAPTEEEGPTSQADLEALRAKYQAEREGKAPLRGHTTADVLDFEDERQPTPERSSQISALQSVLAAHPRSGGKPVELIPVTRKMGGTKKQQALNATIDGLEKALGKNIVFVRSGTEETLPFTGIVHPSHPNTIFLDAAGNRNVLALIGHEWGHTLKTTNPELHGQMVEQMKPLVREWAEQEGKLKEGEGYPQEEVSDEVASNTIGDAFTRPDFWRRLNKKNPSLFRKAVKSVHEFFKSLIAKARGSEWGTEKFISDLNAMHKVIADAVNAAVTKGPELKEAMAGVKGEQLKEAMGGLKFAGRRPEEETKPVAPPKFATRKHGFHSKLEQTVEDKMPETISPVSARTVEKSAIDVSEGKSLTGFEKFPEGVAPIWKVEITPAMEKGISEGQPLFATRKKKPEPAPAKPEEPIVIRRVKGHYEKTPSLKKGEEGKEAYQKGNIHRMYESIPDTLRESGAPDLARAVEQDFDDRAAYMGKWGNKAYKALPLWTRVKKYTPIELAQETARGALNMARRLVHMKTRAAHMSKEGEEFSNYNETEQKHDTAAADKLNTPPAARKMVDTIHEILDEIGTEAERLKVMNQNPNTGKWELFKKREDPGRRYFPHILRKDIRQALQNGAMDVMAKEELKQAMIDDGIIPPGSDDSVFTKHIDNFMARDRENGFMGSLEHKRTRDFPHSAYDYSYATALDYIKGASERLAQIKAYGQGKGGKDVAPEGTLFDMEIKRAGTEYSKQYIELLRDVVFGGHNLNPIWKGVAGLRNIGVATQLATLRFTIRNLTFGMAHNYASVRGLPGVAEARFLWSLPKTFSEIKDGYERGNFMHDIMNVQHDGEVSGSWAQTTGKVAGVGLRAVGAKAVETLVRGNTLAIARMSLRRAMKVYGKNPKSVESRQFLGWLKRLGFEGTEGHDLIVEGGEGPLFDRYMRRAVNRIQAGYSIADSPLFPNTPEGKTFLQYSKWSLEQTNRFAKDIVNPLVRAVTLGKFKKDTVQIINPDGTKETVPVPGEILTALRYTFALAAGGTGGEWLLEKLLGVAPQTVRLANVMKTWREDKWAGFLQGLSKLSANAMQAGFGGYLSNIGQEGWDVVDKRRYKDPFSMPSVQVLKNMRDAGLNLFDEKNFTPEHLARRLDEFIETTVGGYRDVKNVAAGVNDAFGGNFRAMTSQYRAIQVSKVRGLVRRYEQEAGLAEKTRQEAKFGKTEKSPFRDAFHEDLVMKDTKAAQARMKKEFSGMSAARREVELKALKNSMAAKLPIKVANGSKNEFALFKAWAKKNALPSEYDMILKIDQDYKAAARTVLGIEFEEPDTRSLQDYMRLQKIKNEPRKTSSGLSLLWQ